MKKALYVLLFLAILVPSVSSAAFDVSLKYGSKGEAVIELQTFLKDKKFYSGKVTGKYDQATLKAVKSFQSANSLKADGSFGLGSRTKAKALTAPTPVKKVDPVVVENPVVEYKEMDANSPMFKNDKRVYANPEPVTLSESQACLDAKKVSEDINIKLDEEALATLKKISTPILLKMNQTKYGIF
jgi:peptidoglycan hydrolase-like protein with peptidoglycan-binding domain